MDCDDCGERMQRETVVLVMRVRGRNRSVLQPGWFCWTCRVSVHSAGDEHEPAPPRVRRSRRPAGAAAAGATGR